ncbi:MAG: hypothetical protein H6Q18_1014, partial [Bacteroidetes bacterium]|nr:hypothetical protein [Bacteroidota bacterium]
MFVNNVITMKKIVLLIILVFSISAYAANFDFKNLTNNDGLSNSSINTVFQDSNGLMWFGTWDGLNVYNGKEFITYKPIPGDAHSISNNIIRDIIEEKKDYFWIATDLGINRFNSKKQTFERYFV